MNFDASPPLIFCFFSDYLYSSCRRCACAPVPGVGGRRCRFASPRRVSSSVTPRRGMRSILVGFVVSFWVTTSLIPDTSSPCVSPFPWVLLDWHPIQIDWVAPLNLTIISLISRTLLIHLLPNNSYVWIYHVDRAAGDMVPCMTYLLTWRGGGADLMHHEARWEYGGAPSPELARR